MEIRNFWVDLYNSATGARVGRGPLRVSNFSQMWKLSACGEFSFDVSGADANSGALAEKLEAHCYYINATGAVEEFGSGVIDKITKSVEDGRLMYRVSGNDLGRQLSYRSVGALSLAGPGGSGVLDGHIQVMGFAPPGWSIAGAPETQTPVYLGYDGETVLQALTRISARLGEHWNVSGKVVTWLGPASAFLPSGARAIRQVFDPVGVEQASEICIIASIEEESVTADLATRIIPRGSGNGSAVITLTAATEMPPAGFTLNAAGNYLVADDAEAQYGRIERVIDFKEIGPLSNTTPDIQSAANMLLQASVQYLRRYSAPQKAWRVKLSHTGTLLRVGTTLRVMYDGVPNSLDGSFNILEVRARIDEGGIYTTDIVVSATDQEPLSDAGLMANQVADGKVMAAHQQLGVSSYALSWRDEMDSEHGASFRFWLGDEYTSIQRAAFRFRIQPLRSTVKSVGGESTSTSAGGGGAVTSASGGGQTASGGSHLHNTQILNVAPNVSDIGWYLDGGFVAPASNGGPSAGKIFQAGVNANHDHAISAHTHSVTLPTHTHDVIANVSMQYGIFEESAGNTLALADLVIQLNGGSNLSSQVLSLGGGWYAIEILEHGLVDAVYRPSQENNEITITTAAAGKTARLEVQLTLRGVVQAVNYD